MDSLTPPADLGLFDTIDIRAFLETLRLRWWIIPLCVGISIGFLQAQDSDLRTEPISYAVSRSYEVGFPQQVLSTVGITNASIREFPETSTQILILQSNETRDEVSKTLGMDVQVKVPDDYETPFTLSCNMPVVADCEKAIAAYLQKAIEIRRGAIAAGLESLKTLLVGLQETSPDPLRPPQIAAIDSLSKNLDVKFALVDGYEQPIGSTVNQVRRPTTLMGIVAGLTISLLLLLQLTYVDSRVRSVRQLVRIVGAEGFLGRLTSKPHPVRDRRTAISLLHGLRKHSVTRLRYLPLRTPIANEASISNLAAMTETVPAVLKPFAELTVQELSTYATESADVLVVQRNRDLRKDVVEAVSALQRSGRPLAGVLLLD